MYSVARGHAGLEFLQPVPISSAPTNLALSNLSDDDVHLRLRQESFMCSSVQTVFVARYRDQSWLETRQHGVTLGKFSDGLRYLERSNVLTFAAIQFKYRRVYQFVVKYFGDATDDRRGSSSALWFTHPFTLTMSQRRPAREMFPDKEAHQILIDRSLNVRHHMSLQDAVEEYARLEDHEKKAFFLRQFQTLWEAEHVGWDWDPTMQPTRQQNPKYHRMNEVILVNIGLASN